MANIDIESTISDIKLFLQKLKADLPEIFTNKTDANDATKSQTGKVLYLGKLLDVNIILDAQTTPSISLVGEVLHITINTADAAAAQVELWLRAQAVDMLPNRTKEWAQKLGVEYNNIVIKDQRTMWASCSSKKNINYSYRIVKMPSIIIDYLIIHELTHLIHFNHGSDYWATVAQYSPDYKEHRKWLNNNKYAIMADISLIYNPTPVQLQASLPTPQNPYDEET